MPSKMIEEMNEKLDQPFTEDEVWAAYLNCALQKLRLLTVFQQPSSKSIGSL